MNHTLLLIQSPPTPQAEPLELAIAALAFEQNISLVFLGTGLGYLKKGLTHTGVEGRAINRMMSALPMYDCDSVYYLSANIDKNAPQNQAFHSIANGIDDVKFNALVQDADKVLSF